eukprot:TRINITY_DN10280_c0_g1_i1.p1 TRINITY_DN10280_c0_g1~~TRINITY_DN10280_c0_g1_i1.p1  ORF type:complete len:508 (+),score=135.00 TRINITY_DN10280_c0_g1_i1:182-1705(+)
MMSAIATAASDTMPTTLSWETVTYYVQHAPQLYARWWLNLVQEDPGHVIVESVLVLFVLYVLFFKKTLNTRAPALGITHLTPREVDELIKDWQPEPLVPAVPPTSTLPTPVVERVEGGELVMAGSGQRLVNMVAFDFLGFGQGREVRAAAVAAMEKYGCGSCGPRGFYGTIDAHLKLEDQAAAFMRTEAAISYSDSAATVSSCIAAFAKRGDLILADMGVHEAVQTGLDLSRSTVRFFKHNDMDDLLRVLQEVEQEDVSTGRRVLDQRRFIVVEGLYRNFGDLAPMPKLLELKEKYHYRLVVDEGLSFGVLGASGRGVTEHYGLPVTCVDIMTVSLAHALASIGGVCVGRDDVVDHQRLSGAGYCFSAAAPPFTAAAAGESIRLLESEGPQLLQQLRTNAKRLSSGLAGVNGLQVISSEQSPIVHVALAGAGASNQQEHLQQRHTLEKIAEVCRNEGYAVAVSRYLQKERHHPPATIRLAVNALHTREQLDGCVAAVAKAAAQVLHA